MHVARRHNGLAELLAELHDAAVEVAQGFLAAHGAVVEQEVVIRQRHDLEIVVKRRDAPQLRVALAAQHRLEHLARLARRADDETLAVFHKQALGDGGVALEILQIRPGNDLVEVFQAGLVFHQNGDVVRAALLLQAAAHEIVEVADRLCALRREHGQELVHDARHDHCIVARAVVVEVRQAQAVRDLVELVVLEIRQQVLREHQRVEIHRFERDARPAAGRAHEAGIKVGIVRDDRPSACKVEKLAHGLRLVRRAGHIGIRNAGQARDLGRDGHVRVDERVKLRLNLAAGEEHRADLRHAVRVQVQAGRLDIEGNKLRVERQVALPVHGERAVHVVDEVALLAVDDLHAVFLRRLPHIRERLRHAVIRHGDGRVAPVGRAGHEVGGVGDGVERRIAGM